jgi:hypothetical protein
MRYGFVGGGVQGMNLRVRAGLARFGFSELVQVEKDSPRIVKYLKTAAAKRQIDLHPDLAEYLQRYTAGKSGLLFQRQMGHLIFTVTWKTDGLRPASSRWD